MEMTEARYPKRGLGTGLEDFAADLTHALKNLRNLRFTPWDTSRMRKSMEAEPSLWVILPKKKSNRWRFLKEASPRYKNRFGRHTSHLFFASGRH